MGKNILLGGERKVKVRKPNVTADKNEPMSIKYGESCTTFGITSVFVTGE
jgi:hypothetical protein